MRYQRIIVGVLGAVLIALGGLLWAEWRELNATRRQLANLDELRAKALDAEREVGRARAQIAREETRSAQLKKRADALKARQDQVAKNEARRAAQRKTGQQLIAEAILKALDLPKFRDEVALVDRTWNLRMTAPFLRGLGLTPDQVSHAIDLIDQVMLATADANQAANAAGGIQGSDRIALIQQSQQDANAALKAYLGDQNFAAYEAYNQQLNERQVASQLQATLSYTSSPLTDSQASQLIQAMYQTIPPDKQPPAIGLGAFSAFGGGMPSVSDDQLAAAKTLLSPAQYTALQEIADSQKGLTALMKAGGL